MTATAKPTPGPWIFRDGAVLGPPDPKDYCPTFRKTIRSRIKTHSELLHHGGGTIDEQNANGRLIAAAHDLLLALQVAEIADEAEEPSYDALAALEAIDQVQLYFDDGRSLHEIARDLRLAALAQGYHPDRAMNAQEAFEAHERLTRELINERALLAERRAQYEAGKVQDRSPAAVAYAVLAFIAAGLGACLAVVALSLWG